MSDQQSQMTGRQTSGSESQAFARDIVWFTAAQIFVSLIFGMIALPALTKTYTSDVYGIWVNVTVTLDLISPLLSMQLGLAAVRFLAGESDRRKRRRVIGAMLTAIVIFGAVVCGAGILLAGRLSSFLFASPDYVIFVDLLFVWTFFNSIFNFLLSYLRARSKVRELSIVQVGITVLKMVAMVGLARSGSTFEFILVSMVVLQVVSAAYMIFMVTRDVGLPIPNFSGLKTFLAYSTPQMPVILALWIKSLSDRYFVTHFMGLAENGVYSSSATIAALISLFYSPIAYVLFAPLTRLWEQRRSADVQSYLDYSMKLFLTLAIPATVGITVVSQPLLKVLTTSEFLIGPDIVLLLCVGGIFLGIFQINMNVILLDKHSKYLPLMAGAGAVTSIVMNLILVPRIGVMGAAVANCASYAVAAGITTFSAKKTVQYCFDLKYLAKVAVSAGAMLVALLFIHIDSGWGILVDIVAGAAVFALGLGLTRAISGKDIKFLQATARNVVSRKTSSYNSRLGKEVSQ